MLLKGFNGLFILLILGTVFNLWCRHACPCIADRECQVIKTVCRT